MNIQYSHLVPIVLGALISVACSDAQSDIPSPVADPDTYITFAPPTLNLNATVGDFAVHGNPVAARSMASEIGDFRVWGFCVGRNVTNTADVPSTALQEWQDKSSYFKNGADLDNLKGDMVISSSGLYNGGVLTAWKEMEGAYHSFIAASAGAATVTMQPSGTEITTDLSTTPVTTKTFRGPSMKIVLPDPGAAASYTVQPDVMVAAAFDRKKGSGRVAMSFMHLMTGIRFKFHNHTQQPLVVTGFTYGGNFYRVGYLDFTDDTRNELYVSTLPSDTYACTFNLLTSQQTIGGGAADYILGADGNPVTLLLLPNPAGTTDDDDNFVLGSNKVITIHYTIGGEAKEHSIGKENKFILSYLPQPNTLHTANFHFVGDEFLMVFQDDSSKNWENGTEGSKVDITIK